MWIHKIWYLWFILYHQLNVFTYLLLDSIIFRCPRGIFAGLKIHPTIFGHFSNEIDEDQEILYFAGIGSKNYGYETMMKETKEKAQRVTKIRGLRISSESVQEKMNIDLLREFVYSLQQQKSISTIVPQFR